MKHSPQPYHCYHEIVTQASAWRQAGEQVLAMEPALRKFFTDLQPTDVLISGCGSPYYLGESAVTYWQPALGIRCRTMPASELVQYEIAYLPPEGSSPILLLVSRSGATTEAIWAARRFEQRFPGRTLLVSCAPGSPLDRMAALSVLIPDALEQTVPQTRSFAAMYLAVQLMAALLSGDHAVVDLLRNAHLAASDIVARWEGTAQQAASEAGVDHAFYMGAGPLFGVAREGALKMTEMTLTTCSAYTFMEARHGPRAILTGHTLLTGLFGHAAPADEARVMADFTGTDDPVSLALTPSAAWETGGARYHIPVDLDWPDPMLGLAYLPVLHLLAYYRAVAKGVNPDETRNLAPFVELDEA